LDCAEAGAEAGTEAVEGDVRRGERELLRASSRARRALSAMLLSVSLSPLTLWIELPRTGAATGVTFDAEAGAEAGVPEAEEAEDRGEGDGSVSSSTETALESLLGPGDCIATEASPPSPSRPCPCPCPCPCP